MTAIRMKPERKGFLVKVRINLIIFAADKDAAKKQAVDQFNEQMGYTGYSDNRFALPAILNTFVETDGKHTFVDNIEELVMAPEIAMKRNGVWARKKNVGMVNCEE